MPYKAALMPLMRALPLRLHLSQKPTSGTITLQTEFQQMDLEEDKYSVRAADQTWPVCQLELKIIKGKQWGKA